MKKGLKGVTGHSIVLTLKAMNGGISGDFLKPSPISQIDSDLRTIHLMALEALWRLGKINMFERAALEISLCSVH